MYDLHYSELSIKQLDKLESNSRERIIKSLERIRERPDAFVTRLVGESSYRLRVGDYRVILDLQKDVLIILVIEVAKREDVYKR